MLVGTCTILNIRYITWNNSDREGVHFEVDLIEIHRKSNPIPSWDGVCGALSFLKEYELVNSKFCAIQVLEKKNLEVTVS